MKKCDIIIPIFNAYECVKSCIDSVIENTNLDENRLILIDDKSTDERIQPLLKKYAAKYKGILFLSNTENKGFVKTVNIGMQQSNSNDVLLLNSDTEVTKNWLAKIKGCAYSMENVATVTPLSNNATLASVPKPFEPNDIPNGYTLQKMSDLVEKCSHKYYPEVPTGHGFCLYIKREVLDKVGFFDEESFGKGYGEENDFCFRCFEYGYRHILCDDTYILHKESQSFLDSKKELILEGAEVLKKKYPEYKRRLDVWVQDRRINYIAQNVAFALGNREKRPNILFIIHDWQNIEENRGGTSLHAWDLVKNLRDKFNFHILTPENGTYKVYSYFKDTEVVINYDVLKEEMTDLNFYNNSYKLLLTEIVENYNITYAHIHHLRRHYFDIVDVFKSHNIKYMVTLHDFYSQCPFINKLFEGVSYCGNPTNEKCNQCILGYYERAFQIDSWQKAWKRLLINADKVVAPSIATKSEILEKYPEVKIDVIEHGIDIKKTTSNLTLEDKINHIAFIGAIGIHKGSKYLDEFIDRNLIKNCKIHLFGISNTPNIKNNRHFENHGSYKREELKDLLMQNNIKLICLFSIWPETYSYTLTEAVACGIPVITFNMGAIAERVKKYNLGWIIDKNCTIKMIATQIEMIMTNKEEYQDKVKAINNYKIISSKEMAEKYNKIYSQNARALGNLSSELEKMILRNDRIFVPKITYPDYSWILNTPKWKIISKLKIPKPIKRLIKKIRKK